MPPSHHSSSTSRSSSSSRSSSFSSHSSSSRYSSTSRSGPSSRSYSSHYSSSDKSSFFSGGKYNPTGKPGNMSNLTRYRSNQPTGFEVTTSEKLPREYHCKAHDYVYYGMDWFDKTSGKTYKKGYYDENGKYYDQVAFKNQGSSEIKLKCEYCDTEVKTVWTEGQKPSCPNCGAPLTDITVDEIVYKERSWVEKKQIIDPLFRVRLIFFGVMVLVAIIMSLTATIQLNRVRDEPITVYTQEPAAVSVQTIDSSIYVEEIGRRCDWDDYYQNYYDPETDCYFVYNDYQEYPAWQYWYEGISSDFGEYGWMEYDEDEQCWYIETEDGWIVLPEEYDTSYLWHIKEK